MKSPTRFALFVFIVTLIVLFLTGCTSGNGHTKAQCDDVYTTCNTGCDTVFAKEQDRQRCRATCAAVRVVCLITAEPEPTTDTNSRAAKRVQSRAERWSVGLIWLMNGVIDEKAFEDFVIDGISPNVPEPEAPRPVPDRSVS